MPKPHCQKQYNKPRWHVLPPKATNPVVIFSRESNSDKIQDRTQRTIINTSNQSNAFKENTNKHPKEVKEDKNKMIEVQRNISRQMNGIEKTIHDTNVKFNKEIEIVKKTQIDYEAGNEKASIVNGSV